MPAALGRAALSEIGPSNTVFMRPLRQLYEGFMEAQTLLADPLSGEILRQPTGRCPPGVRIV